MRGVVGGPTTEELTTLGNALALYTRVRSPAVRARLEAIIDDLTDLIGSGRTFADLTVEGR